MDDQAAEDDEDEEQDEDEDEGTGDDDDDEEEERGSAPVKGAHSISHSLYLYFITSSDQSSHERLISHHESSQEWMVSATAIAERYRRAASTTEGFPALPGMHTSTELNRELPLWRVTVPVSKVKDFAYSPSLICYADRTGGYNYI